MTQREMVLRQWIGDTARIAVLTGAGMSAESGIAPFAMRKPACGRGLTTQELATEDAFRAHPQRVWDWYAHRRHALAGVLPNAGHLALAALAQRHPRCAVCGNLRRPTVVWFGESLPQNALDNADACLREPAA